MEFENESIHRICLIKQIVIQKDLAKSENMNKVLIPIFY